MALHTDIPTRAEIEGLLRARAASSVSIYLQTGPISHEVQASRIELKNAAGEAVRQLREADADKADVASIQESLDDFVDDASFWRLQSHSLAVFATPEHVQTFRLANRLGASVEVSDRFHVKPLLRAVTFPQAAFVLALAQGSAHLLEITPDEAPFEVAVDDIPRTIASAVGKSSITDRSPSGRMQGAEGQKVRMRQYARQVDGALRAVLSGHDLPPGSWRRPSRSTRSSGRSRATRTSPTWASPATRRRSPTTSSPPPRARSSTASSRCCDAKARSSLAASARGCCGHQFRRLSQSRAHRRRRPGQRRSSPDRDRSLPGLDRPRLDPDDCSSGRGSRTSGQDHSRSDPHAQSARRGSWPPPRSFGKPTAMSPQARDLQGNCERVRQLEQRATTNCRPRPPSRPSVTLA
jgi:hypothetical protein